MFGSRQLGGMMFLSLAIGLVAGLSLAGFGVWLVSLGAQGTAKVSLLGQRLDSTNVGVTSIFIGAVTLLSVVRWTLRSINDLAKHPAPPATPAASPTQAAPDPALTLEGLHERVRVLSAEQRELLAMISASPRGAMVIDVQDALGVSRAEAVYRARDLVATGLVEIVTQTDQCFMLSRGVRALKEADSAGVVRVITADI